MRSEMLLIESQYSGLRRNYETMELDFKQALAHSEQAGPITNEMRSLISTLQTQNKQLKAEVSRHRRKYKDLGQDFEKVLVRLRWLVVICVYLLYAHPSFFMAVYVILLVRSQTHQRFLSQHFCLCFKIHMYWNVSFNHPTTYYYCTAFHGCQVRANHKSTEEELSQVRSALKEATAAVIAVTERAVSERTEETNTLATNPICSGAAETGEASGTTAASQHRSEERVCICPPRTLSSNSSPMANR